MWIIKKGKTVINVDSKSNLDNHLASGWALLTHEQIEASGMLGYEYLVSPTNTVVNADGSITFTPPEPPSADELFSRLRIERDTRINSVLWMRERHADELTLGKETSLTQEQYAELLTYVQALRDLPAQPGAPWDGGDIPWPIKPNV